MPPRDRADWILRNARQIVTLAGPAAPRAGPAQAELGLLTGGAVAVRGDRILAVAGESEILSRYQAVEDRILDCAGGVILPGFVDPHTHVLFAGTREHEFEMRCQGKTYLEIAAAGGGIRASVRAFRAASDEEILRQSAARLDRMLAAGSTTVEVKTGYGLDPDQEIRALHLIEELNRRHPVELVPTFLGAHEVPDEYRDDPERYVSLVCDSMLPRVARETSARFCDVFCEEGVFDVAQTERILLAAKSEGLGLKVHVDEFVALGGTELAARCGAVSADHLLVATDAGLRALRAGGVIAVVLPGTSFSLAKHVYADGRRMVALGIPVALGTDCNPGSSMVDSMPLVIALACLEIGLSPAEAVVAATVNAAFACGVGHDRGRIEPGLRADLQVLDAPSYVTLAYHLGAPHVRSVFSAGRLVYGAASG